MTLATNFAVTLTSLYALHSVADHWVQTNRQAVTKGRPDITGRLADLRHTATLTATLAAGLLLVGWRVGIHYQWTHLTAALAVNAGTHYWSDRRVHLLHLARSIGKGGWLDNDPQAAYALDQSWHLGWLLVTALIAV